MKRGIKIETVKKLLTIGIQTMNRWEYDMVCAALGINSADEMLALGRKHGITP